MRCSRCLPTLLLLLSGCGSVGSGPSATLLLRNPTWERVNVEAAVTKSPDCDKREAYVQGLSPGMQQRLCLAHTLVHDPQVLLLDEPASGLDPRARVELRELLRELRKLGKTILISSHILPELEELCTSVAIVDHGQVLAQGRVADIEKRLRYGAVLRVRILGDTEALEAARDFFTAEARVASVGILDDGQIELGFRGDDAESAELLAKSIGAGIRVVSFARAASDLEELFLQVTSGNAQEAVA